MMASLEARKAAIEKAARIVANGGPFLRHAKCPRCKGKGTVVRDMGEHDYHSAWPCPVCRDRTA